jgi:putative OPT family oligopeptide transporter
MRDEGTSNAGEFKPFIPASARLREFTPRALIVGTLLGMVFGASSLYLVLKVGLTVSASIPVAVISLALFRLWSKFPWGRDATVLENNIVQTAGSAGESVAFGLGVTMPAILILGFDLELGRVMLVGLLGALLGILMMIPLRRALIVEQHLELKYPEGTACAQVLKAGADPESRAVAEAGVNAVAGEKATDRSKPGLAGVSASTIFTGFGIGLVYKTVMSALKGWKEVPEKVFGAPLKSGSVAAEISPELLGVGYIIGPRISCIMVAGGVLSYLLLIPLIKFFGEAMTAAVPPGTMPIRDMSPNDIRGAYILYIGAGAVAAGGIISLIRSLPVIVRGVRAGLADFSGAAKRGQTTSLRTDQDLSMKLVGAGCLLLIGAILAARTLHMNILGAVLILVFGFLFVTVSSRLTGEIGSSSNPISGMTVATLLLTCLIFVLIGWTGGLYYVTALSVGGIVCTAASNAGATSQDLKTGFLLGATPKHQQIAILIGAAASALVLGPILLKLNTDTTVFVPIAKVAAGLHAPAGANFGPTEKVDGRTGRASESGESYRVWQKLDDEGGRPGKYLVNETGAAVWFVDPGINGAFTTRVDGTEARKFEAPKAVLMSYIIKGILDAKLPWALVLFGVMISVVLELSGIPALAFAVGVYLPISTSAPIFIGGLVRWLVDRGMRRGLRDQKLDEAQLVAQSDKSPGVMLASGYIAGGAIAGIIIAFMAGVLGDVDARITRWATTSNPFFAGANADWLALFPFLLLVAFLYLVGRERLLKGRQP